MTYATQDYEQALEEWAEAIYRELCQLQEIETAAPELLMPHAAERSGTDG